MKFIIYERFHLPEHDGHGGYFDFAPPKKNWKYAAPATLGTKQDNPAGSVTGITVCQTRI